MAVKVGPLVADEALVELWDALDSESTFMLAAPGERGAELPRSSFRVVDWDGPVATGLADVQVMPFARVRHRGQLRMGVRASHQGRGVGRRLLEAAVEHARHAGLRKVELTVRVDNARAISLYRSVGFQVEGLRRASMAVDGDLVDEHFMALILH
ncbi:ribosomal protein S18 acetylase RimI-like enzyme [Actinocorallia herbida]|uniref:Ribosomal protein S18 acetylase RimI-like enzyme n=1 Tax=Actinocorallia herbida TaxID=58109 RepID=A0A3N1D404_9ACTN|nr:GNAT family N-acetyltransferase [Actinocorallia herbida]ROO87798.1 ribosomal protein S18 acetylase RimI-like enzyme [Actinocorallia herbida]